MTPYSAGPGHALNFILPVGLALVILLYRNRRPRKLRIELLWIRPLIYVALMASSVALAPPPMTPITIAMMATGLVLGAALGWQRGRFTVIEVDPETHALTSRASTVGMVLILGLIAVRLGLRGMFQNVSTLPFSAMALTDALLIFVVAMMVVQGLEMWLRARRLLTQAQAAKAAALGRPSNPPIVQ